MSVLDRVKQRFKLRELLVNRIDLVDRGANQFASIELYKAAHMPGTKPKPATAPKQEDPKVRAQAMVERMRARQGGGAGPQGPPGSGPSSPAGPRPQGGQPRIARFDPGADFVLSDDKSGMKEWTMRPEKLPQGMEEVSVLMASGKDGESSYQWIVDPKAGPPIEGTAKTPQEAFMAIRRELTTHNAGFGAEFGGLPMQTQPRMPGAAMGQRQQMRMAKRTQAAVAIRKHNLMVEKAAAKKKVSKKADVAGNPALDIVLTSIAKGLADADVFVETVTGDDLRGILPDDVLEELSSKLSAVEHRGNQEDKSDG